MNMLLNAILYVSVLNCDVVFLDLAELLSSSSDVEDDFKGDVDDSNRALHWWYEHTFASGTRDVTVQICILGSSAEAVGWLVVYRMCSCF